MTFRVTCPKCSGKGVFPIYAESGFNIIPCSECKLTGKIEAELVREGGTNPKAAAGRAKPPLHAIPPSALLWLGLAMEDGEKKYGLTNWRSRPVDAATYYDAAFRHLLTWWDGEREASDSKVHHLGHVMACCAILLDAEAQGTLEDNRPEEAGATARLIEEMSTARKKPD